MYYVTVFILQCAAIAAVLLSTPLQARAIYFLLSYLLKSRWPNYQNLLHLSGDLAVTLAVFCTGVIILFTYFAVLST